MRAARLGEMLSWPSFEGCRWPDSQVNRHIGVYSSSNARTAASGRVRLMRVKDGG
jgi:hypothetical protein